ncbi:DUF3919 family protein [Clostridiales bacterium COT073_COT-073]|nr:DUF3919 family protein [Clostridiales bacterium COT073_COT-073]
MNRDKNKILKRIPLAWSIVFLFSALSYIMYSYSTVYTVEDESYLFAMINDSIPSGLYVEDYVWKGIYIENPAEVIEFYEFISGLSSVETVSEIELEQVLKGNLYFTGGKSMDFQLGEYLYLDGQAYGNKIERIELKKYSNLFRKKLYTKEKLLTLINAQNKIQIRIVQQEKKLAMDQKQELSRIIDEAESMNYEEKASQKIQNKGAVLFQIEIYIGENNSSPQVYVIMYENGLCMIYDSFANQSGSIMQFSVDIKKVADFIRRMSVE